MFMKCSTRCVLQVVAIFKSLLKNKGIAEKRSKYFQVRDFSLFKSETDVVFDNFQNKFTQSNTELNT